MSYTVNALVQCENWQERLPDVWDTMPLIKDPIPQLEFILSPENMNGFNFLINPGEGKTRTGVATYTPPVLESEVIAEDGRNCNATAVPSNRFQNYEIDTDDVLSIGRKITAQQLKTVCVSNPDFILQEFIRLLVGIDKAIATRTANETALLLGKYSTYVTTDAVTWTMAGDDLRIATKSGGAITPGAWENVQSAATASGMSGIVGFGGSSLNEYMNLTKNGCCANQGLDIGAIYNEFGFAFGYDPRVALAIGTISGGNMIMVPGALQLLHYTQNGWLDGVADFFVSKSYNAFTFQTPAGVPVDVFVTDNCPNELTIKVIANTKLAALPNDMYQNGDPFVGVTGTAGVVVVNA